MEVKQFDFIPFGKQPTVYHIWNYFWKGVIVMFVITLALIFYADAKWSLDLLLLFSVLTLLLTSVTLSNQFITKIHIDKINNKFYKYYITARGEERFITIDLNTAKINYKLSVSRAYVGWELKIKDKNSFIKIRETKNPSLKTQKNVFIKTQLDQMNELISSF
ncbi:MAG: hypothetical protein ACRYFL_02115 [Janthinobacterium lividum]